jgi:hypothetical protein
LWQHEISRTPSNMTTLPSIRPFVAERGDSMCATIERPLRSFVPLLWVVILAGAYAHAQSQTDPERKEGSADLSAKIEVITHSIEQMESELAQSRQEIQQLRDMLAQLLRTQPNASSANPPDEHAALRPELQTPEAPPARIAEDDWQVLNARVEEHEQVKVDSSSKFRLKLSGIVLFNVFDTSGQLDNLDAPTVAVQPPPYAGTGSVGASFRQSVVGLRGIGPTVFGARTSADLDLDFLNGAADPYGGIGAGQVGLRTARVRFDWSNFSVTGGLEAPFFSPNMPTSYLSLAVPAFSAAGNLWNWTPEIRAERRFDFTSSEFKVEAGLLDSTGYSVSGSTLRLPTPGESSRQPVYAVRLSGNNRNEDRAISFGVSGIYVPLRFPNRGTVSGSGAIADWKFPLPGRFQVSGAFFTGKGLDGFGGLPLPAVQAQDYQHYIYVTAPTLAGIPVIGGWSQLKFTLNSRSEFNAAAGLGEREAGRLRAKAQYDPLLLFVPPTNRSFLFNYIFRPRSDLVFSAEYRRFHTNEIPGESYSTGQVGLAAGFLF